MVSIEKLEQLGHIRTERHPTLPLVVCKYTRPFQHRGLWDKQMLTMRGSVYHDDGTLVSQPLNKFFNYGEKPTPEGGYVVQRKLDGTCIVVFRYGDEPVVHTLGRFTSPQAAAARDHIERTYGWEWLYEGATYVFEWLDPDNFTTLRHRGEPSLVLLTWLVYGREVQIPATRWPGPVVESIAVLPDDIEALQASVPDGEEGYVLVFDTWSLGQRQRMKVKGDRYLALHRAKWNLSERVVWDYVFNRRDEMDGFLAELDEEAVQWFRDVQVRLERRMRNLLGQVDICHQYALDHGTTLRDQIEVAKRFDLPHRQIVLARLNGKDIANDVLVRELRPQGNTSYALVGEV